MERGGTYYAVGTYYAALGRSDGSHRGRTQQVFRIASVGMAVIVGAALLLSTAAPKAAAREDTAARMAAGNLGVQMEVKMPTVNVAESKGGSPTGESASDSLGKSTKPVFDALGRFIMHSFDRFKPMASFLPGVAGVWGVPMWAFYVNRGQGVATFGVQNKENGSTPTSSAFKL